MTKLSRQAHSGTGTWRDGLVVKFMVGKQGVVYRISPWVILACLLLLGAGVALIPNLPVMKLLVGVQVLNGGLLPIVLVFILLLANDRRIMGGLKNSRLVNLLSVMTVAVITVAVLILLGNQIWGR